MLFFLRKCITVLNGIKDNLLILENYFEDNNKNIPPNFNLNKLYELLYKYPEFLDLCKPA